MKPLNITVGATALMVAPPRFPAGCQPSFRIWALGEVVVNGDIRTASSGRAYWCVVGGTCAVEPTAAGGSTSIDGTIQWAQIVAGERRELNVTNSGATGLYVAVGFKPAVGEGMALYAAGGSYNTQRAPCEAVYAISSAGGGVAAVQDL